MRSLYARLNQRFGTIAPAADRRREIQLKLANFQDRFDARIEVAALGGRSSMDPDRSSETTGY